ncbi:MAG TPA: hypothetical protein DCS30_18575 [Rhizobiales bacterium]|nr:hypothetical protein [Hyphomicrobiales bacterium]
MYEKRHIASTILTAAILATGISLPDTALAKDWVEKVSVKRDGIDTKAIRVSANMGGYTAIKTKKHKFLLKLHARATKGKRIVALKIGSFKGVQYFEADGNLWSKSFAHREVGSGSKRTVSKNYNPSLAMHHIRWSGSNPKARCDANLQNLKKKGQTKQQILTKKHQVKAYAYFELDAVAARKNKAKKGWKMSNTTNQRGGYKYEVMVTCSSANNVGN